METLTVNWANAFDVVGFSLSMVFVLLIMIVIVLTVFSRIVAPTVRVPKKQKDSGSKGRGVADTETEYIKDHLSAGDSAAIAMALYLYYSDEHDEESAIITIKKVERRYSPWSSKIYGLNNLIK
ncbi:MAG TPA: OadG family protein [Paludibacter sp.]|nr:OadG family protein [Paludibacter sp.]